MTTEESAGINFSTKTYEVWSEGYSISGNSADASLMGTIEANTFQEACEKLAEEKLWLTDFDPARLTYWGCRLFDNEQAARESFG